MDVEVGIKGGTIRRGEIGRNKKLAAMSEQVKNYKIIGKTSEKGLGKVS